MRDCKYSHHLILLSLLFFVLIAIPPAVAVQNIAATWGHSNGKDSDASDAYSLQYTLNLDQKVSQAMSLQESIRYNRGWYEQSDPQHVDATLGFAVKNDLFQFGLSGLASQQQNSGAATQKMASWAGRLSSSWDNRFWPNVQVGYSAERLGSGNLTTNESQSQTVSFDWDLELFKTYCNFQHSTSDDVAADRQSDSTSNFARLETAHDLWQNRLSYGFSQQFSDTRSAITIPIGVSGLTVNRLSLSQVLHGLDSTPLVTSNELSSQPQLHDGDLTSASSVSTDGIDDPPHNIAIKVDYNVVDEIKLYTTVDESAAAAGFSYVLYASDNGTNWQMVSISAAFTYDSAEKCFELPLSVKQYLWLKVVITASPLDAVDFTEVEAYQEVTSQSNEATLTSTSVSSITDLNLSARITDYLTMSYNISLEKGEYGSGVGLERYNQGGLVNWQVVPSLSTGVGITQSSFQNGDGDESVRRSYNGRIDIIPMDTVNVNMGLGRSENYLGSERQTSSDNIGLYATAALYPDLDGSFGGNYAHHRQDDTEVTTKTYGANFALAARLRPGLTADVATDYQRTSGDAGIKQTALTFGFNWRLTDMLSFQMSGNKQWIDGESLSDGGKMSLSMVPTATTQLSMNYVFSNSTESVDSYTIFGSWALGPHFSMQGRGSYSESGGESTWRVQSQLAARFSGL